MASGGVNDHRAGRRPVRYLIVPADLAGKLHEALRRHFRDDPSVEVLVERRNQERRADAERRAPKGVGRARERRAVRSTAGRRVGERRAAFLPLQTPELPRRARAYADRLRFVERSEPRSEQAEDLDTARLVTRFQAGDQEAFAAIYMRYFDRVYAYLRIALDDVHAAEDATQQVFTQVFEAFPRYERRRQPFRAWLFVIVRNHAINQLQKQRRLEVVDPQELDRRRELCDVSDEGLRTLGWISDRELLLFIERLPLPQRQVLVLRYLIDLSTDEIAAVLGRSTTDVRTLDYRARGFLRKRLTALGRDSATGDLIRMRRWGKPASVLRSRRFALIDR